MTIKEFKPVLARLKREVLAETAMKTHDIDRYPNQEPPPRIDESPAKAGGHSPGPWHVETSNGEFRIVAANGQTVFIIGDKRRLIPMLEDRMLIASAPALLEALRLMVDCPDYRQIETHEMNQARAAIEAATRS